MAETRISFDSTLFTYLLALILPVLFITIPRQVRRISQFMAYSTGRGDVAPSWSFLLVLNTLQTLIFVVVPAAIGSALAHRVGLRAPVFQALIAGEPLWPIFRAQLVPALAVGLGGAVLFISVYYGLVRPELDSRERQIIENLRMQLGVLPRLLYAGIVEEVVVHWGIMTLCVWLGVVMFGSPGHLVVWAAIFISGIVFALGHVPPILAARVERTSFVIRSVIGLNLLMSVPHGWLFWQYGLEAAMLAHLLLHLVWLPFDLHYYRSDAHERKTELVTQAQDAS